MRDKSGYIVVDQTGHPITQAYPHLYQVVPKWSPYVTQLKRMREGKFEDLSSYEQQLAYGIYQESYGGGLAFSNDL